MTNQPTPEAVEAVAGAIRSVAYGSRTTIEAARAFLAFIRDAINRDGDDADAIREALGLRLQGDTTCGQHIGQCFIEGHKNRLALRRVIGAAWWESKP